jgi:hypothetical protein
VSWTYFVAKNKNKNKKTINYDYNNWFNSYAADPECKYFKDFVRLWKWLQATNQGVVAVIIIFIFIFFLVGSCPQTLPTINF